MTEPEQRPSDDPPSWAWRFFSPPSDDDAVDEEPAEPQPNPSLRAWAQCPEAADPRDCPLKFFLPHLSQRSQRILRQLGAETVGDILLLSREEVFAGERDSELVILEWNECFLEPRKLSAKWWPQADD